MIKQFNKYLGRATIKDQIPHLEERKVEKMKLQNIYTIIHAAERDQLLLTSC